MFKQKVNWLSFLDFIISHLLQFIYVLFLIHNHYSFKQNTPIPLFFLITDLLIRDLSIQRYQPNKHYNIIRFIRYIQKMGIFCTLHCLYNSFSALLVGLFFLVLVLHVVAKVALRKKPLKLDSESVVIITGGCMGIGKIMAIQIAKTYHSLVIIIDRRKDLFEEVSQQIKKHHGICQCLYSDLSDENSVEKVLQQIKESHKKVDLFLYNAGVFIPHKAWDCTDIQLKVTMNVNFFTPVQMIKSLMKQLEGGHVGVVSSVAAISDKFPEASAYSASKHAIYGYMNSLRYELKQHKKSLTISIACPYAINTGLFRGFKSYAFSVLDENYVGKRIVSEFIKKKEVCYIGRRHALVVHFTNFLPTQIIDGVYKYIFANQFPERKLSDVTDRKKEE